MVIWQILGDSIGPDDGGAAYYPTKAEAMQAVKAYRAWRKRRSAVSVRRIIVMDRKDLCRQLNDAMGFGAS